MMKTEKRTLISISQKAFFQVLSLLVILLVLSIILTYVVPKGSFGELRDGGINFLDYHKRGDLKGIEIWRGLLAPILVFASEDGLTLIMLTLFLFVISASFQVMNDVGGIRIIVGTVSEKFKDRPWTLLVLISLLFYCFGAFLGLFEEMLTMLPIITALCIAAGFDSFTGFICCTLSCGFGFAGAITNPFTVLLASQIIGANPVEHLWFRILISAVMFGLLTAYLAYYTKTIKANPQASITYEHDRDLKGTDEITASDNEGKRTALIYTAFLLTALILIIVSSMIPALRSYTVVILTAYFLIFGILAGVLVSHSAEKTFSSFLRGLLGALPTTVFIAFAASIKYVFDRGSIMPTIIHQINILIQGHSPIVVAMTIYLIVLLLEFFISSSTAKAILVMGLLGMVSTGLSRQMLVLLYTFGDGYTNVIFPTSPVLLISLSMIGVNYFTWLKKSRFLFFVNLILVVLFIILGVKTGY